MWKLMAVKGVSLECFGNIHTARGFGKTLQWLLEIAELQRLQKVFKNYKISPGSFQRGFIIGTVFLPLPSEIFLS